MRHYAKLLRATLTALLMLVATAGAAVAEPIEDGLAAYQRGDFATALRLLRPLAGQGNADAQYDLGVMYRDGKGVPQDYAEAVKWWRKAADQGNAHAQGGLGGFYEYGWGVLQDKAEAANWYRRAAAQGNKYAQYTLGNIYASGRDGVPLDYVLAYMWFTLAATGGDRLSERDRDIVAAQMTPAQIVAAQKLAREWKPKPER